MRVKHGVASDVFLLFIDLFIYLFAYLLYLCSWKFVAKWLSLVSRMKLWDCSSSMMLM